MDTLGGALTALEQAILAAGDYPCWAQNVDTTAARTTLARTVVRIHYEDGQDPHSTRVQVGVIGAPASMGSLVAAVNAAKAQATKVLRAMGDTRIPVAGAPGEAETKELLRKVALRALGHSRLHRWQLARELVWLGPNIRSVSFIWARSRKVQKTDVEKISAKLTKKASAGDVLAAADLRKLAGLSPDEPLALVRPPHVHASANIVRVDEDGVVKREKRRAVLPLFVECEPGAPLPRIRALPDSQPDSEQRLQRSDVTLESTRFLDSMAVYRYRP